MRRRKLPAGLADATALFRTQGLELPFVPQELASRFRQRGPRCFASREVRVDPYEFERYVREADPVSDYVLVAHSGHGVNSYAIHYYLAHGLLRLFLQIHWGGAYQDQSVATARANACFRLAAELVLAIEDGGRRRKLRPTDRVVVVASDFYGGSCQLPGEEVRGTRVRPDRSDLPEELMTRALHWCCDRWQSGQHLPNLTDVPGEAASWPEIAKFALTFDGYEFCGSFEKCSQLAHRVRKLVVEASQECSLSIPEARACLFHEQRAARWLESEPEGEWLEYVKTLVSRIREALGTNQNVVTVRPRGSQGDLFGRT